jgi:hypothetical protein
VQTSADLITWTTIAQSIAGASPSGVGFVSERAIAGEAPLKLVTAQETVPAGVPQRFARLQVVRQP